MNDHVETLEEHVPEPAGPDSIHPEASSIRPKPPVPKINLWPPQSPPPRAQPAAQSQQPRGLDIQPTSGAPNPRSHINPNEPKEIPPSLERPERTEGKAATGANRGKSAKSTMSSTQASGTTSSSPSLTSTSGSKSGKSSGTSAVGAKPNQPMMPSDSPSVTECLPAGSHNENPVTPEQTPVPDQGSTPASNAQPTPPSMNCPYIVESIPVENGQSTLYVFVIRALGIRWQQTYRNSLVGSEWLDLDPKHIPWRVIAGNRGLQGWNLRDINRQLNPRNRAFPFEVAGDYHRGHPGSGDIALPIEHPRTYAEIRQDINGHFHVYVYFGDTNEKVTIDIDVLFLNTDIGYRIQAIVRHSQRRGQPLIVEDPDENIDGQMNAWSGVG